MEAKHLLIGVVIFAIIGTAIFYLGSLLTKVDANMKSQNNQSPPIVEIIGKVEELKIQTQEAQKNQEKLLKEY